MSEVLARIKPSGNGQPPLLRVRCASCDRVYETRAWAGTIRAAKFCSGCLPGKRRVSAHGASLAAQRNRRELAAAIATLPRETKPLWQRALEARGQTVQP